MSHEADQSGFEHAAEAARSMPSETLARDAFIGLGLMAEVVAVQRLTADILTSGKATSSEFVVAGVTILGGLATALVASWPRRN